MKWVYINERYVNLNQVTQIIIYQPTSPKRKWVVEFRFVDDDSFHVEMEKNQLYLLKISLDRELDVITIPFEKEEKEIIEKE